MAGADASRSASAGLDLHDADRCRCRRAAAGRHHGRGRCRQPPEHSRHRRWRHQVLRRSRQGHCRRRLGRHGRLRCWPAPTKAPARPISYLGRSFKAIAAWLGGRHGARFGRPLFPGRGARHAETGAGRHRGPGAQQGPGLGRAAPACRRLRAAMGYVGGTTIPDFQEKANFVRISGAGLRESHTTA